MACADRDKGLTLSFPTPRFKAGVPACAEAALNQLPVLIRLGCLRDPLRGCGGAVNGLAWVSILVVLVPPRPPLGPDAGGCPPGCSSMPVYLACGEEV